MNTKYDYNSIKNDYESGKTLQEIELKYGCHSKMLYKILKALNVSPNRVKKYTYNENAFSKLNSDTLYWLGVLFADGYINIKTFSSYQTVLSLIDKEHIEKFNEFLNGNFKILSQEHKTGYHKKDGTNTIAYRININNDKLAQDIINLGFLERNPDKKLVNSVDFWRGVIDGDGSLYFSKGRFYITVTSDYEIVNSFRSFVQSKVGTNAGVLRDRGAWKFGIANQSALKIASMLYENCNYYLNRKMEKYLIAKKCLSS